MSTKYRTQAEFVIGIILLLLYTILAPMNLLKIKSDTYYFLLLVPSLSLLLDVLRINFTKNKSK